MQILPFGIGEKKGGGPSLNGVRTQQNLSTYSVFAKYVLRNSSLRRQFLTMALQFRIREQKTKFGEKEKVYYYAQTVLGQKVTFDELCEELADGSTVDVADVKAVVNRLAIVISRNLKRSCAVDCGDLGTFRPSLRSKASETAENFDVSLIKNPAVIFTPKPDFKNSLIGTSFRAVSNKFVAESSEEGKKPSSEDEEEYKPSGHSGL